MKTLPIVAVIKQTNIIEGRECSAWFVRHHSTIYGQYHSEGEAIEKAMAIVTLAFMRSGTPLDATAIGAGLVGSDR